MPVHLHSLHGIVLLIVLCCSKLPLAFICIHLCNHLCLPAPGKNYLETSLLDMQLNTYQGVWSLSLVYDTNMHHYLLFHCCRPKSEYTELEEHESEFQLPVPA